MTLATLGSLRLVRKGFQAMPLHVAIGCVGAGILVVGFAIALLLISPADDPHAAPGPIATLQPIDEVEERAPGKGLAGRVVSLDDEGVADVAVRLRPLFRESDGGEPESPATRTDDQGRFDFPDVVVNPGSPHAVEATFDETVFATRTLRGPNDELEITVVETTEDDDDISITSESLAIVGDETGAQAVHAMTLRNAGSRAYIGTVRLPLLTGAQAIQEGGELDRRALTLGDDAMVFTAPILPGTHEYSYTYAVQMTKDGISFERNVSLPTTRYELLVGGELTAADVEGLETASDVELGPEGGKRSYRRAIGSSLEPDDEIEATFAVRGDTPALIIGAVIVALVAIGIVLLPVLRRRRIADPGEGTDTGEGDTGDADEQPA